MNKRLTLKYIHSFPGTHLPRISGTHPALLPSRSLHASSMLFLEWALGPGKPTGQHQCWPSKVSSSSPHHTNFPLPLWKQGLPSIFILLFFHRKLKHLNPQMGLLGWGKRFTGVSTQNRVYSCTSLSVINDCITFRTNNCTPLAPPCICLRGCLHDVRTVGNSLSPSH